MLPIFNEYKHATDMNNGAASDRDREEKRVYSFRDLVIYTKWLRWSLWSSRRCRKRQESVQRACHFLRTTSNVF